MPSWVALLRAVNIANRAYPMARLRATLEQAGYEGVATHIQSGNALVRSPLRSRGRLESELESLLLADIGFAVTVICLGPAELSAAAADCAELSSRHEPAFGHYVSFLKTAPTRTTAQALEALSREGERVVVRGRAVHQLHDVEYHRARTSNAAVERVAGPATNRNARVVAALSARWGTSST